VGEAFALNKRAAEIAREALDQFADGRARFVLGGIGPGTKLPSLGHIAYQALEDAFTVQSNGLLAAASTQYSWKPARTRFKIKAAVNGAKKRHEDRGPHGARARAGHRETTGTLLVGSDIAAARHHCPCSGRSRPSVCELRATGPKEMTEHVKWLGEHWPGLIFVQPNAGLPQLVDGKKPSTCLVPRNSRRTWNASCGRMEST